MELLNNWFGHYEPTWLFIILALGLYCEAMTWKYSRLAHFFEKQKLARYKGWKDNAKKTKESKEDKEKDISLCEGEMK